MQLYKKETPTKVFSCEYWEIFRDRFFYRTPPMAASDNFIKGDHPSNTKRGGVCIYYKETLPLKLYNINYVYE